MRLAANISDPSHSDWRTEGFRAPPEAYVPNVVYITANTLQQYYTPARGTPVPPTATPTPNATPAFIARIPRVDVSTEVELQRSWSDRYDQGYREGFEACRAAMLQASTPSWNTTPDFDTSDEQMGSAYCQFGRSYDASNGHVQRPRSHDAMMGSDANMANGCIPPRPVNRSMGSDANIANGCIPTLRFISQDQTPISRDRSGPRRSRF